MTATDDVDGGADDDAALSVEHDAPKVRARVLADRSQWRRRAGTRTR
jgi:hypothetical protein